MKKGKRKDRGGYDITLDDLYALGAVAEDLDSPVSGTEALYGAPDSDGYGMTYRKGCHYYNLHDQEDDASNSTESGGVYDEASGPKRKMSPV